MKMKTIISLCTSVAVVGIIALGVNYNRDTDIPQVIANGQNISNKIDTSVINAIDNIYNSSPNKKESIKKVVHTKKIEKPVVKINNNILENQPVKIVRQIINKPLINEDLDNSKIIYESKGTEYNKDSLVNYKNTRVQKNSNNIEASKNNDIKKPIDIVSQSETKNKSSEIKRANLTNTKKETEIKPLEIQKNATFKVKKYKFPVNEPFIYSFNNEGKLIKRKNLKYKAFDYSKLGVTATLDGKELPVIIKGNVDNKTPGIYMVELEAKLPNGKIDVLNEPVEIQDSKPIIEINTANIMGYNLKYSDFIIGAFSAEGENLTNEILVNGHKFSKDTYLDTENMNGDILHISVKDKYGLETTINIKISVLEEFHKR